MGYVIKLKWIGIEKCMSIHSICMLRSLEICIPGGPHTSASPLAYTNRHLYDLGNINMFAESKHTNSEWLRLHDHVIRRVSYLIYITCLFVLNALVFSQDWLHILYVWPCILKSWACCCTWHCQYGVWLGITNVEYILWPHIVVFVAESQIQNKARMSADATPCRSCSRTMRLVLRWSAAAVGHQNNEHSAWWTAKNLQMKVTSTHQTQIPRHKLVCSG